MERFFKKSSKATIVKINDIIFTHAGSLDRKTADEIFALFLKIKSRSRAIIYATHNRELSYRADYMLRILDGNIVKKNE